MTVDFGGQAAGEKRDVPRSSGKLYRVPLESLTKHEAAQNGPNSPWSRQRTPAEERIVTRNKTTI